MIRVLFIAALLVSLPARADTPMNALTLTRFAIQSLYAPKRLIVTPEGLHRVPMQTEKHVSLFYGASLDAMPLASWRAEGFYVTAVEVKNLLDRSVAIDVKTIKGDWQTTAIYPSATLASRDKHETSTLFLVSTKPFQQALDSMKEVVR